MESIIVGLHIFVCVFLIVIILLQAGKGADVGAVFGGASQTMFGGRGPASFLNKMTIVVSLIFLLTSIGLAKLGQHKGEESVIGKVPPPTNSEPAEQTAPAEKPVEKSAPVEPAPAKK